MCLASFSLAEVFALGGSYERRLKDSEIRFRGTAQFKDLVSRRIPASKLQVDTFEHAIDLLDIWDWRIDYRPEECGWSVLDGSAWSFAFQELSRTHKCCGANAYPSFADATLAAVNQERFALLVAAFYDAFSIEAFIHEAKRLQNQAQLNGQNEID